MTVDRVILIVLDGVGVGALPDAREYGDADANSVANTAAAVGGLQLPNLGRMGLGNLTAIRGVGPRRDTIGPYGKARERSAGKDSIAGHWELCGAVTECAQPTFPHGFPAAFLRRFEAQIGVPILGNRAASGTVIIEELGPEHERTGQPIVYTSADSVLQIAAHEAVIPVDRLYAMCQIARDLLQGDLAVGRVIARPFVGTPGSYQRTEGRRDWALQPPAPTVLDRLAEAHLPVAAVGKVTDIMAGRSITRSIHATDNVASLVATLALLEEPFPGLIFSNFVEFDQVWGHRNDPAGYARALEQFDRGLPSIWQALQPTDLLVVTGDHGCDPMTASTDHSREYVPILVAGDACRASVDLGIRPTFADIGQTIADLLGLRPVPAGESFRASLARWR